MNQIVYVWKGSCQIDVVDHICCHADICLNFEINWVSFIIVNIQKSHIMKQCQENSQAAYLLLTRPVLTTEEAALVTEEAT